MLAAPTLNIAQRSDVVPIAGAAPCAAVTRRPRALDVRLAAVLAAQALAVAAFAHPVAGTVALPAVARPVLTAALLAVLADRVAAEARADPSAAVARRSRRNDAALLAVLTAAAL